MVIANPIYDVIFIRLMQKTHIAKFFMETVLEETIEHVEVEPQERLYHKWEATSEQMRLVMALVRFDFIATIKTVNNEYKKVLIEIQKARHPMDIKRFRNYLGINYQTEDVVYIENGKKTLALPIISIYLLGFKLPDIPTPVLKVSRQYIDQISHKVIDRKDDFVERLTHDCHVVQIPRIESKLQTQLEQLLTIFEQKNFVYGDETMKEYQHPINNEYIKEITEDLNYAVLDPETRKEIDVEQEAYRVYNLATQEADERLAWKEQELEESRKTIEEDKKTIEDMANEIAELKRKLDL